MSDPASPRPSARRSTLRALPGVARIGAEAWWRTTSWAVGTTARAYGRVLSAAVSGESTQQLLSDAGTELREYARAALGVIDPDGARAAEARATAEDGVEGSSMPALRRRGEELLRRSADVRETEDAHPAFARILDELAPDEARILRFLALEGPQPSVDVRTARPLNVGSQMVSPGVNMIGAQAGCRYVDRVHAYLNNLYRLGLVWFSREPVEDPLRYQVLEAQPEVAGAMREAGRGKTVRRSIHLTPFGEDFCSTCLPLNTAEIDALPGDTVLA